MSTTLFGNAGKIMTVGPLTDQKKNILQLNGKQIKKFCTLIAEVFLYFVVWRTAASATVMDYPLVSTLPIASTDYQLLVHL